MAVKWCFVHKGKSSNIKIQQYNPANPISNVSLSQKSATKRAVSNTVPPPSTIIRKIKVMTNVR